MLEYLTTGWDRQGKVRAASAAPIDVAPATGKADRTTIDVTAKLYIGGKQARPDGGQSYTVYGKAGAAIGEAMRRRHSTPIFEAGWWGSRRPSDRGKRQALSREPAWSGIRSCRRRGTCVPLLAWRLR